MKGALNQQEAAEYLGVSVRYFRDQVPVRAVELPGTGSKPVLRWRVVDLDAWLASHLPKPTRGRAA